tara:strand:- start:43 stop:279 length:237 start_codon:yes stop_codon:yes gene_type:complete
MKLTEEKIQQFVTEVLQEVLGVPDPPEENTDCPEGSRWSATESRCEPTDKTFPGGGYAVPMESIRRVVKEEFAAKRKN